MPWWKFKIQWKYSKWLYWKPKYHTDPLCPFWSKLTSTIKMLQFTSILIHFNHLRCEKARKIQKRLKNFFRRPNQRPKLRIWLFYLFFMILILIGSENLVASIFLVFEAAKAKKATKRLKLISLHRSVSTASNFVFSNRINHL